MIRIWRVPLSEAVALPPARGRCLDEVEVGRAERFADPVQGARWRLTRVALREILAEVLGVAPATVPFRQHTNGRTTLDADCAPRFSLSHTTDLALVAVGEAEALGVDLEQTRPVLGLTDLLHDVFTPGERQAVTALPTDEAQLAFLRGWTRKEAVVKALGRGIEAMGKVEVTLDSEPRLRALDLAGEQPANWSLADLRLDSPFVGVLAVRGAVARYELRDWTIS